MSLSQADSIPSDGSFLRQTDVDLTPNEKLWR